MNLSDLKQSIGQELGVSDWVWVDQQKINAFADCTEDHQFIHVDPERAKATPFGSTIAHGFLTAALLPRLAGDAVPDVEVAMSINYGFNRLRFLSPVLSRKRIRGRFKLLDLVETEPRRWQETVEAVIEIEGEAKPALIAEWIFLHFE